MRRFQKKHAGIRIDQIRPAGGIGLLFVAAVVLIIVVGLPQIRLFALAAFGLGLLCAAVIYFLNNQTRW